MGVQDLGKPKMLENACITRAKNLNKQRKTTKDKWRSWKEKLHLEYLWSVQTHWISWRRKLRELESTTKTQWTEVDFILQEQPSQLPINKILLHPKCWVTPSLSKIHTEGKGVVHLPQAAENLLVEKEFKKRHRPKSNRSCLSWWNTSFSNLQISAPSLSTKVTVRLLQFLILESQVTMAFKASTH